MKVTLREYFERILEEQGKSLQERWATQENALTIASRTLELRLEKLNELRQEVTTDRGNYLTKEQFDSKQNNIDNRIEANVKRITAVESFNQRLIGIAIGASLFGGIVGALIVKLVIH